MISISEISGTETPEAARELAWRMFCDAHPHEAHDKDPEAFFNYVRIRAPHLTRDKVAQILKET